MIGFWEALETSTKTEARFGHERQQRFMEARAQARSFYDELQLGSSRLQELGVDVKLSDHIVSFKKGSIEVLVVNFGAADGNQVRMYSPVVEYLKLTPSAQDVPVGQDVSRSAGEWLGRSIDVVERHRDQFDALGLN